MGLGLPRRGERHTFKGLLWGMKGKPGGTGLEIWPAKSKFGPNAQAPQANLL